MSLAVQTTVPALSVVIPTYRGEHRIIDTLRSLERQSFRDFEVIVVIDGVVDNTEARIRATPLNLDLHLVVQENKGRAGARNAGVKNARAQGVVFIDDDITLTPHVLQAYYTYFQQGEILVVGGLLPLRPKNDDFYYFCKYLEAKWTGDLQEHNAGYMSKPDMSAANAFIRKNIFLEIGAFDERLRDAEDFDLAVRLFEKGYRLYHDAAIEGSYIPHQSYSAMAKRHREYRAAHKVLRMINAHVEKYMPYQPWQGSRSKKILFKLLAVPYLITLVDSGFFRFLPARARFKVYDVILTANTADFS
jgi:glycosyltransferase involved in cell wall biosynthesis